MAENTIKATIIITVTVLFLGALINLGFCSVNYWNTPWTETPWHCHSR